MSAVDYLYAAVLLAAGFILGWVWRSYVERQRRRRAAHLKEITRTRRTPARPGTQPSVVRKARLDRGADISNTAHPSDVADRKK